LVFRGGGRVFGPRPRDYEFKLNKKLRRLARKSALAYKVQENNIMILEDFGDIQTLGIHQKLKTMSMNIF
jgi:ribosomal protein L4